jgi:hypothetical protein
MNTNEDNDDGKFGVGDVEEVDVTVSAAVGGKKNCSLISSSSATSSSSTRHFTSTHHEPI